MDTNVMKGSFHEYKGKIRQMWGRLTDDDIAKAEGSWEELAGRLQKTYGYTKEQADEEVRKFKNQNLPS